MAAGSIPSFDQYVPKKVTSQETAIPAFDDYKPKEKPQSGVEGLKSEGFLESAWKALTSPVHGAVEMLTPHSKAEKMAQVEKALKWADRFVAAHNGGTDAEKKAVNDEGLVALPFGSTVYKAKEGNYTGAAGDLAGMATLGAIAKGVEAAPGTRAGIAVKAGAKAAASDVGAGGAMIAGGEALAQIPGMSYPARIGLGLPGARQVGVGLKKGISAGKKAYADVAKERAMVADAAKIPPDVMAELTRESSAPGAPPIADPPEVSPGQPIPEGGAPVDLIRQQNEEALARLQADQASRAQTGPVPVRPTPLLGPGPANIFEAPPAPDGSFVRAVPAQYPQVEPQAAAPKTLAQQVQESAQAQPTAPAPPVPASSPQGIPPSLSSEAAPGATRPVVESPQSGYTSGGERKSPELRGAEITAANTTSKAKRFAEAMAAKGVTADIAEQMQAGRVSDAQIGKGAAPRWGNLADFIGETEPKSSVPEIIAELRKMEGAKTSTPTSKESLQVQPARSVKDMTRAELAKQAGLPENATTDQIMKALADAMEEEKPKAAAAGKGKQ